MASTETVSTGELWPRCPPSLEMAPPSQTSPSLAPPSLLLLPMLRLLLMLPLGLELRGLALGEECCSPGEGGGSCGRG